MGKEAFEEEILTIDKLDETKIAIKTVYTG